MFLLNGEAAQDIEIADRGLQYGDGFFTTIHVHQGQLQLWLLHWQRLCECAERLGFAEFCSEQRLLSDCQQLLRMHQNEQHRMPTELVLRITITRGAGGRGYAAPTQPRCNVLLALSPMPTSYAGWREKGVTLALSHLTLGDQPMLNGLKTLNRLEQVLLKQALVERQRQHEVDDLLVLDQRGFVAECTAANILWSQNGQWFTPALDHGGVRGVMRQAAINTLQVSTGDYPLQHLLDAEHVLICNALMGVISVQRIVIDSTTECHFSVTLGYSSQLTKRICENE